MRFFAAFWVYHFLSTVLKSSIISVAGEKGDQGDHPDHPSMLFRRRRTFAVFEEGHSLCSKKDIPCVRRMTFFAFEERFSLCSRKDIACVRRSTFPNRKICNNPKIARVARISTIFRWNRSRRPDPFFPKSSSQGKKFASSMSLASGPDGNVRAKVGPDKKYRIQGNTGQIQK